LEEYNGKLRNKFFFKNPLGTCCEQVENLMGTLTLEGASSKLHKNPNLSSPSSPPPLLFSKEEKIGLLG